MSTTKIKIFEGIKVINDNGTEHFKDMDFFKCYHVKDDQKTELIRALIITYPALIDLSDAQDEYEVFKIRLLSEYDVEISKIPWYKI